MPVIETLAVEELNLATQDNWRDSSYLFKQITENASVHLNEEHILTPK